MALNDYGECFLTELDNIQQLTGYFTANSEYDILIPTNNLNIKFNSDTLELESIILISLRKSQPINLIIGIQKKQYGTAYCKGLRVNLTNPLKPYLVFNSYKDDNSDYNIFIVNLPKNNKQIAQTNTSMTPFNNILPNYKYQDPRIYFKTDSIRGANGEFLNSIQNLNVNYISHTLQPSTSYINNILTLNIPKGEKGDIGKWFYNKETIGYFNDNNVPIKRPLGVVPISLTKENILNLDSDNYFYLEYKYLDYNKTYLTPQNITLQGSININLLPPYDAYINGDKLFFRIYLYKLDSDLPEIIYQQYLPSIDIIYNNLDTINLTSYKYHFLYHLPDTLYPIEQAYFIVSLYKQYSGQNTTSFVLEQFYPTINVEFEINEITN